MNLSEAIKSIRRKLINGDLTKRNGNQYSDKSIYYYSKVIDMLLDNIEDFNLDEKDESVERHKRLENRIFMDEWCKTLRNKIRAKGAIKNSENSYISVLVWVFGKINEIYGYKLDISGSSWSRKQEQDNYVPEPEKIKEFIQTFAPLTLEQEIAYKYIVSAYYTSARYEDMKKWTSKNIVGDYLVYVTSKNGKKIKIPFNNRLKKIFGQERLLPAIPKTTLWSHIKNVFHLAGFDSQITKKVDGEIIVKKEYELISLHRIRACSITGMLSSGMSDMEVKQFSGHSRNSSSFNRYIGFSQDHLNSKISAFMQE
jgi:hypothetical protein